MSKIELQVVGKDAKYWFVRNKGSAGVEGRFEQDRIKKQLDSALKLQESIEDMLEKRMGKEHPDHKGYNICMDSIQALVVDSEK